MQLEPNPIPLDDALNSVRRVLEHRKLNCPNYARCLDVSIERGWESFSCVQCPVAATVTDLRADPARFAHAHTGDKFGG